MVVEALAQPASQLQTLFVDKTDVLREQRMPPPDDGESWAPLGKCLAESKTLTQCRIRCCTGVPPLFEEQLVRVTLRNRLARDEISQEEHDAVLAELGIDTLTPVDDGA